MIADQWRTDYWTHDTGWVKGLPTDEKTARKQFTDHEVRGMTNDPAIATVHGLTRIKVRLWHGDSLQLETFWK